MSATFSSLDDALVRRVRSEFREIPGLRLTVAQAQRLWGLDRETCEAVLSRLTETHVIAQSADGRIFAVAGQA
jgi:hypothetical protein